MLTLLLYTTSSHCCSFLPSCVKDLFFLSFLVSTTRLSFHVSPKIPKTSFSFTCIYISMQTYTSYANISRNCLDNLLFVKFFCGEGYYKKISPFRRIIEPTNLLNNLSLDLFTINTEEPHLMLISYLI